MDQPMPPVPQPAEPPTGYQAQRAPRRGRMITLVVGVGFSAALAGALLVGGFDRVAPGPGPAGDVSLAAVEQNFVPAAEKPGQPGKHRGQKPAAGGTLLFGTVSAVQDGKLVVTRDGGGDVTVTTDAKTKVRGSGNDALADLKQGTRVVVRVNKDNKAVAVSSPKARAVGTVTKLDGDRATVTGQSGLAVAVDLAAVKDKPKVGDLVAIVGSSSDGGAVLKAEQLRQLPRAGN